MNPPQRYLFVAVHQGPYLSIQPLELELGPEDSTYLVEGAPKTERSKRGLPFQCLNRTEREWGSLENFLKGTGVKAVVRSSSEDVTGRNVERLASVAARNTEIPVFVVEDFPGNYWHDDEQSLDGLFVEDESMGRIHRYRGVDSKLIHSTGNPRYGALECVDTPTRRTDTRHTLALSDEPVILWAGQPDDDNSYLALERLLRHYSDPRVRLLFRAHPRDGSYGAGRYQNLLATSSMQALDVSSYPDVVGLYCASDLVITQFSSAAVEASHLGIPALFVLFDDLGKEYLRSFKGYDTLPWCDGRCSFLIEEEEEVKDVLEQALFDEGSRNQVRANFQRRFRARPDSALAIAHRIRAVVGDYRGAGGAAG